MNREPLPAGPLRPNDVHIWTIDLAARLLMGDGHGARPSALDDAERARADRFRFERDRERYVVAHEALRRLIGAYLGRQPEDVEYERGARGKPRTRGLEFSLTHADDVALAAFAPDRAIGIDVEPLRAVRDLESVASNFFTPREAAAIAAVPSARRDAAFLACWTRKEAVVKALGLGLSVPLDSFDVSLPGDEPARILAARDAAAPAASWSLTHLALRAGYIGALATRGTAPRIAVLHF